MAGHFPEAKDVPDAPVESDARKLTIAVRSLQDAAIVHFKIDQNQRRGGKQSGVKQRVDFRSVRGAVRRCVMAASALL